MRQRITISAVFLIAGLTVVGTVWAGPQARVSGVVVDVSGAPIPGATITLTSAELPSYSKSVNTDADGEFRVLILDATKTYLFTVTADGYLDYTEEIKVSVGTTDNEFTFELSTKQQRAEAKQKELMEQPGYKEYGEAKDLLAEGKTAEARARFEDALVAIPDLVEALEEMVGIDYDSGDYELALETARRCLAEDDESIRCLAVASNAAGEVGDVEARKEYLARYQALNPDDPATVFNQAVGFLNSMDDEGARPLLEQCLAVDPEFAKCLFEYGMLLLRSGDLEGAKATLEKYLEVAPDGADAVAAAETVKYL
jgi:tetratricopeptide (TPR) repeat protein